MYVSCKFIDKQHSVATALESSFSNVFLHFANPHTLQLAGYSPPPTPIYTYFILAGLHTPIIKIWDLHSSSILKNKSLHIQD